LARTTKWRADLKRAYKKSAYGRFFYIETACLWGISNDPQLGERRFQLHLVSDKAPNSVSQLLAGHGAFVVFQAKFGL
jgi:hypothetical protein